MSNNDNRFINSGHVTTIGSKYKENHSIIWDDTLFNDIFECVFNYASSGGGTLLTGRAALKGMFFRPLKVHCKGWKKESAM